jgi:eukaryotic-like serine/threonine-protein kinase
MSQPHPTCDPRRIEGCLADSLGAAEMAQFEEHLESCSTCREVLESSAAGSADWKSAREFLSSDDAVAMPARSSWGRSSLQLANTEAPEGNRLENPDHDALLHETVDGVLNALAPTDDPHMLGRLGPYEIAGIVGRGGMGVVLKALDPALNRYVAIKVLAPQLATSGAARQRFAREARAAASVVHENVVAIHAVADSGALPYFVMPYLRGASLQKRLDSDGPLGVSEILRVSIQIAAGLSAAHAQGLVHRDIKPANILLEDGVERLKITDFGLARAADDASLTRTGVIAGTPQFMSPEQARGELVDSRSDLFSLASVMYAMCTARPPFRSETSYGTLQRICESQPRLIREINPEIPVWLAAFIGRLHEKRPDDRFQTAHEVAQLLEQCLAHVRQPDVAPLPLAVSDLIVEPKFSPRRAAWHILTTPRPRRAASIILAATAALITTGWVAARLWPSGDPVATTTENRTAVIADRSPLQSESSQPGPAPTAAAPVPSEAEITRQLLELKSDIDRLERRMSVLENPRAATADQLRRNSGSEHSNQEPIR